MRAGGETVGGQSGLELKGEAPSWSGRGVGLVASVAASEEEGAVRG